MTDPEIEPENCPLCRGIGWVLEGDPTRAPLTVEFDPCPAPECPDSGRPVETLAIRGRFRRAIPHPTTRAVMSLTGSVDAWTDSPEPADRRPAPRPARKARRVGGGTRLPPGARPSTT